MFIKMIPIDGRSAKLLTRIRRATGWSASEAIRRSLWTLDRQLRELAPKRAFDIYRDLDLGPGGYARGPARRSSDVARSAIREDRSARKSPMD